jgi:hypothetical protein
MANTPAYMGAGAATYGNSTGTHTLDIPTDPAGAQPRPGDIVFLVFTFRNGSNGTISAIESGWNSLGRADNGTAVSVAGYYRVWTTADGTTNLATLSDVTMSGTVSAGFHSRVYVWRRSTRSPAVDTTAVPSTSAAAATWTPTGITTTSADETLISFVGTADDNTLVLNTANGFALGETFRTTTGSDHASGMAYKDVTSATGYTCPTWQQTTVGNDVWAGLTVAFRDDASGVAATLLTEQLEVGVSGYVDSATTARMFTEQAEVAISNPALSGNYTRMFTEIVEVAVSATVSDDITTGTADLIFTAQAPTVAAGSITAATGTTNLTFSAQVPTVATGSVTAATGSVDLVFSAQATSVAVVTTLLTGSAELAFSAQAPTVTVSAITAATGTVDLTLTAQTAAVAVTDTTITTGTADVTFTAQAPDISGATVVQTGSGDLTLSAQAPTVTVGAVTATSGAADLVFTAQTATVTVTAVTVVTDSASLTFTAQAPEVSAPVVLSSAPLTFTAQAPTVTGGAATLAAGSAVLLFGAETPTLSETLITVEAGSADLLFTPQPPDVSAPTDVDAESASLVFAAQAATVTNVDYGIVLTESAPLRFVPIGPFVDNYESTFITGSAVLTFLAQAPTLQLLVPPIVFEEPVNQSQQGETTYDTYKRRTFDT